jgi:hypothetical protein
VTKLLRGEFCKNIVRKCRTRHPGAVFTQTSMLTAARLEASRSSAFLIMPSHILACAFKAGVGRSL